MFLRPQFFAERNDYMAKQLFNSSDKSNFILNMTQEAYSSIAIKALISTVLITSVASAIPLISGIKVHTFSAMGLMLGGVFCLVLAIIALLKKFVEKRLILPMAAIGFGLVWAFVSMINSYDMNVSLNGYAGRGEGVFSLLFYASFFVSASALKGDKFRKTLLGGILVNGFINSVVGIIQIFTGEFSDFANVSLKVKINAAAGLSQSPIFLAMVLSISIVAAISGLIVFEKKKSKIMCVVCICLFSFVNMFTYSLVGICGTALAVIVGIILIIALKAPKINLLSVLGVIIPSVAAVIIVNCGLIGNIDSYRLYDGRIMWFADSYMRLNSSGDFDRDALDIDDTGDVYYTLNRKAGNIISSNGLLGTGPDQFIYPQLYNFGVTETDAAYVEDIAVLNKGTIDRVYNEYLNVAATRGIPSVIAFAAALLGIIAAGIKSFKRDKNSITLCMLLMTLMSALLFVICCSSTAFTPIFWIFAGACVARNNNA